MEREETIDERGELELEGTGKEGKGVGAEEREERREKRVEAAQGFVVEMV